MLARILTEPDGGVQPLVWRNTGMAPAPARQPGTPTAPDNRDGNSESEARLQQQVRQAYEAGVREGQNAARQQVETELRQLIAQLAQAAAEVAASRAEAIRRAEADLVQLSIEIARRIIHRELSVDASALAALIRAALDKLASQKVHRVRVHPEQEQLLRACLDQTGRGDNIEVVSDPLQPRGGAIFESSRGSLDASVETQLREIERGLADQLQERA